MSNCSYPSCMMGGMGCDRERLCDEEATNGSASLTKIKDLEEKLAIATKALSDWIEWEKSQILKDGDYQGSRINELIKQGKEALAKINEFKK